MVHCQTRGLGTSHGRNDQCMCIYGWCKPAPGPEEYQARSSLPFHSTSRTRSSISIQSCLMSTLKKIELFSADMGWKELYAAVNKEHDDGHVAKMIRALKNGYLVVSNAIRAIFNHMSPLTTNTSGCFSSNGRDASRIKSLSTLRALIWDGSFALILLSVLNQAVF
jgi:hypothetical protein